MVCARHAEEIVRGKGKILRHAFTGIQLRRHKASNIKDNSFVVDDCHAARTGMEFDGYFRRREGEGLHLGILRQSKEGERHQRPLTIQLEQLALLSSVRSGKRIVSHMYPISPAKRLAGQFILESTNWALNSLI